MEKILGKWKFNSFLTLDGKKMADNDPEMERMRYIIKDDGTILSGFCYTDEVNDEFLKEVKDHGFTFQDGVIITETKKWKEVDGKIYSDISSVPESETKLAEMGPVEFEGDYLKIFVLFAFALLEKEA